MHQQINIRSVVLKPEDSTFPIDDAVFSALRIPLTTLQPRLFPRGHAAGVLDCDRGDGLGILIASHVYMSCPEQVARQSAASAHSPICPESPPQWSAGSLAWWIANGRKDRNPGSGIRGISNLQISIKSLVSLGDKFALASGLMEITYDTGAKVILQGPVTYEVEANGGYLAVGKLTGKLEKRERGETRGERCCKSSNHEITNHDISLSPLPLLSSLFVIHTPTATVTDLGTEFGVEVTKDQQSHLHVFQGKVVVRTQAPRAEGRVKSR